VFTRCRLLTVTGAAVSAAAVETGDDGTEPTDTATPTETADGDEGDCDL
jgi:hypothetical protein